MSATWLQLAARRVAAAALTLPSPSGWGRVLGVLACTGAACLPFGLWTRFLDPRPHLVPDKATIVKGTLIAFVCPGLLEEALFRAALLPHPKVDRWLNPAPSPPLRLPPARVVLLPLALFVAYHLINPQPRSRAVFTDWRFLTLAGMLGAGCTAAYCATSGSLLAVGVVHWVPVTVWLFGLGGYSKLYAPASP